MNPRKSPAFLLASLLLAATLFSSCVSSTTSAFVTDIRPSAADSVSKEARDAAWAEDIRVFADTYRRYHPLLTTNLAQVENYRGMLTYAVYPMEYKSFYDAELRLAFTRAINALTARVPELSDDEIIFGLSEIVALLGDSHSRVDIYQGPRVPFVFTLNSDGNYCVRVPAGLEHALLCKLTAINGVGLDELYERTKSLYSYDNDAFLLLHSPFYYKNILQYIGVAVDESTVSVTLEDAAGEAFTLDVPWLNPDDETELVRFEYNYDTYLWGTREDENYWYEYLPEDDIMYVRYRSCHETEGLPSVDFWNGLREELVLLEGVGTFVLDLRGNGGGFLLDGFVNFVKWLHDDDFKALLGSVYIPIGYFNYSYGVVAASLVKNNVENAILIGEPTEGQPNFFAWTREFSLPNTGLLFSVSSAYLQPWPGYEHNTLLPDIAIYRTVEDMRNSYDPVLEYIRSQ